MRSGSSKRAPGGTGTRRSEGASGWLVLVIVIKSEQSMVKKTDESEAFDSALIGLGPAGAGCSEK